MERTIIVGDIHGCYVELLELLERVGLNQGDTLVSVGDLVDRGPESVEVLDFFRTTPNSVVLMGNHERKHVRQVLSYSQEIARLQFAGGYEDARSWMRGLPYYLETEHVRVVHAAVVPGVPLAEQKEEVLCGSAAGEKIVAERCGGRPWYELYEDPKPIVFGHHVVGREPLVHGDVVFGIDTGACHGWRLTALSVPDFKLYSVAAREDHWNVVKRRYQLPVLRSKPWRSTAFRDFAEKTAEFVETEDAEVRAYLDALEGWAARLQSAHRAILAEVTSEAARIRASVGDQGFPHAVRNHPASALFFLARKSRLDATAVANVCATPARTLEIASALGIVIEGCDEPR